MIRLQTTNGSNLRMRFAKRPTPGSLLEIDVWMPSEIERISPLVDRLMPLIATAHCITGQEPAVELALREALSNAVIHGNRLDARKSVHVRCRCEVGRGISVVVSDQGQGFDLRSIPDPVGANLAEHGRGIQLMKAAMDVVSFQRSGAEVQMCKRAADQAAKQQSSKAAKQQSSKAAKQQSSKAEIEQFTEGLRGGLCITFFSRVRILAEQNTQNHCGCLEKSRTMFF